MLLALGLTTKRWLFLFAVAAAAMGAIAGGSRGTIIFLGVSLAGTIAAVVMVKPNGRTLAIAGLAALGLVAAAPFAIHKLDERNAGFENDPERIAFEQTAKLMIADHPWGVGLNHYVSVANLGGYFDKAGVRWGYEARSTNVHNTYLLMRAEGGLLGLFGFLVWLLSPVLLSADRAVPQANAAPRGQPRLRLRDRRDGAAQPVRMGHGNRGAAVLRRADGGRNRSLSGPLRACAAEAGSAARSGRRGRSNSGAIAADG